MFKFRYIIVWQKPNGNIYYRLYRWLNSSYYINYFNNYNHKLLLIINLNDIYYKIPLKKRLVDFLIEKLKSL